jgi:murein DD-endopeptidase MepM/ murein hydrolase activator NlpD
VRQRNSLAVLSISVLLCITACGGGSTAVDPAADATGSSGGNGPPIDEYLHADFDPADGFDFPVGDVNGNGAYTDLRTGKRHEGWYIATEFCEQYALGLHTGEDWNGVGGGSTDYGQDVRAVATGRVAFADTYGAPWGNIVGIDHIYYVNNERKAIRSVYAHLAEIRVRAGDLVKRRQLVGTIGSDPGGTYAPHLHLELRWDFALDPTYWPSSNGKDAAWIREHYATPTPFIAAHRSLEVPQRESVLLVIDSDSGTMRLARKGQGDGEFQVGFGQAFGPKRARDDLKTPRGMYFVVHKTRGPFEGPYAEYYGGHWIAINYPNPWDAARGRASGLILEVQEAEIRRVWGARKQTLRGTKLGDGIGFHGWKGEWTDDGPRRLSWGCVVMHNADISRLFDSIPVGAMVVIL